MSQEQMTLRGTLQGHGGWVTQIATNPQYPETILSASRGISCSFNFQRNKSAVIVDIYLLWAVTKIEK